MFITLETKRFGSNEFLPVPLKSFKACDLDSLADEVCEEVWDIEAEADPAYSGGNTYIESVVITDEEDPSLWVRFKNDGMSSVKELIESCRQYICDARREYEEDCFAAMTEAEEAGWDWEEE